MEKVILTLRGAEADDAWCARLRAQVAADLLDIGLPGLAINVRDAEVRDSLMTLTTMDPPVAALVSVWTQQSYGDQVQAATSLLEKECDEVAAYLVTESVPLPPPQTVPGQRTAGLANVALLRRPADLDEATWLSRWHIDHTPVAIETQATFGYTQNAVVRALTPGAPTISAIVEELFPGRGDIRSARVLRRGRRRRPARPDGADGRQHRRLRRQPECRHRAHQPLRLPESVRRGKAEGDPMTTLDEAVALARGESGLTVVSTLRADNTIQASLVNAGVLPHPENGSPVLAFVTYGRVKLANLRARPQLAATFRNGWQWATVEGDAELAGPDDPQPWLSDGDQLRLLLRDVFTAAGGTHDDWDEYDRTMAEQRRTAVLVAPTRVYSNG